RQSPPAVTACKGLIQSARHGNIGAAYTAEREAFVKLFDTRDQREGVNAFLEKRAPNWVNG
ncbi:MAG: enoyl-CoA hydratase, partial [Gammaproteobacteria bacterium]